MPLSPKQHHAVLMLTLGVTKTQTAQRCGVARSTLDHWLNDPEVAAEYDTILQAHLTESGHVIRGLSREAIQGMAEGHRMLRTIIGQEDADPRLRSQASHALLREGRKWLDRLGYDAKSWDAKTETVEDEIVRVVVPQAPSLPVTAARPAASAAESARSIAPAPATVAPFSPSPSTERRPGGEVNPSAIPEGSETKIVPASTLAASAPSATAAKPRDKREAPKGKGSFHVPFYRKFQQGR